MNFTDEFNRICLTFDTDWCPEFAIKEILDIIRENNLKATFFVTHDSKLCREIDGYGDNIEIGIHPNFFSNSTQGSQDEEILDNLIKIYPNAIGVRSHSLFCNSRLLNLFKTKGLSYDSNLFLWKEKDIAPFRNWNDLIRIPYFWEDYPHIFLNMPIKFDSNILSQKGLKIFNFHPILVYLNCSNLNSYENLKEKGPVLNLKMDIVDKYVSKGSGVKTFLVSLSKFIKENRIKTYTLKEIYSDFLKLDRKRSLV